MKKNTEWIVDSLNELDPALLEELSAAAPARAKRPAPMRVLTAAACVAALLVVGAVAAEVAGVDIAGTVRAMLGIQVSEPKTIEKEGQKLDGWTMSLPETLTNERFSKEFLADFGAVPTREDGMKLMEKEFSSWEELKEYLGTAPTLNPILEQGSIDGPGLDWKLSAMGMEGNNTISVDVHKSFMIPIPETEGETLQVWLSAWFTTTDQPSMGTYYANVGEITQESYVAPNGLKAAISQMRFVPSEENPDNHGGLTCANFYLDGFGYKLEAWYEDSREVDEAQVTATLKSVLDAFQ